jgi:DMSO/TMAO reductase YedYZ molybdopterin-dependent catalytic subunit
MSTWQTDHMDTRDQLPNHPIPDEVQRRIGTARLCVDGLVARSITLEASDLLNLPRARRAEPFTCEEGWTVPGTRWRGLVLADVLALARPLTEARYVRVCSGDYAVPVPLSEANTALLCEVLNDEPLTLEHGAPWRLLVPQGRCFTSVKWVDRLEVTAEPGRSEGEQIARARLRLVGSGEGERLHAIQEGAVWNR